jgi:hypothetical protein
MLSWGPQIYLCPRNHRILYENLADNRKFTVNTVISTLNKWKTTYKGKKIKAYNVMFINILNIVNNITYKETKNNHIVISYIKSHTYTVIRIFNWTENQSFCCTVSYDFIINVVTYEQNILNMIIAKKTQYISCWHG